MNAVVTCRHLLGATAFAVAAGAWACGSGEYPDAESDEIPEPTFVFTPMPYIDELEAWVDDGDVLYDLQTLQVGFQLEHHNDLQAWMETAGFVIFDDYESYPELDVQPPPYMWITVPRLSVADALEFLLRHPAVTSVEPNALGPQDWWISNEPPLVTTVIRGSDEAALEDHAARQGFDLLRCRHDADTDIMLCDLAVTPGLAAPLATAAGGLTYHSAIKDLAAFAGTIIVLPTQR